MYLLQLRDEISQGDIFLDVPFSSFTDINNTQGPQARIRYSPAMLLSHSCDFDKANSEFALMAPIDFVSRLGANELSLIRKNKVINALHLAEVPNLLLESYVDFRRLSPIPKVILGNLSNSNKRIASVTDLYLAGSNSALPYVGVWPRLQYFFGPRKDDLLLISPSLPDTSAASPLHSA